MANTLAYYDTATITAVKSFIVQAPGVLMINTLVYYENPYITTLKSFIGLAPLYSKVPTLPEILK